MGVISHQKKSTFLIVLILICISMSIAEIQSSTSITSISTTTLPSSSPDTISIVLPSTTKDSSSIEEARIAEIKQSDLDRAESKDPKKLEIVKQIRRLNTDGSYTLGYEAEDGTFKIESRDVLGNVKGTYGYVDANGEIKRVSYTANNNTGLKPLTSAEDLLSIRQTNSSKLIPMIASTRRPTSLSHLTSSIPPSPTRASVIQPIPRRRPLPTERANSNGYYITSKYPDSTLNTNKVAEQTTTVIYATSAPNTKPMIVIRPTPLPHSGMRTQEQIGRPEKLEIDQVSKVHISSSRETSTSKPVIEIINEKETDRKYRGNHFRRQLPHDQGNEEQFETQQQVIYSQSAGEEGGNIYGGSSGSARHLFTTTNSPRIPQILLEARQRAKQHQNLINNNSPTTNPPRRPDTLDSYEQSTEPSSENTYLTQSPGPVVQIPANRDVQAAADDEPVVYRRRPVNPVALEQQFRPREYQRGSPPTPIRNIYRGQQRVEREQYLRETTQNPNDIPEDQFQDDNLNLPPYRGQRQQRQQFQRLAQQEQETNNRYEQQSYLVPHAQNPYRQPYPQYYNYPERPLTTRDFERLLQLLVLRHQQLQQNRFGFYPQGNPYLSQGYSPSLSPYINYQQIPRPPLYDSYFRPLGSLRQYSEPENMYQAQNQLPITDPAAPYEGQRLVPRKKQFNPRYFGADYNQQPDTQNQQQDYLPPDVREDLLYRMLMLAIQSEQALGSVQIPTTTSNDIENDPSTTTTATIRLPYSKKPVRSVQIIGED